MSLPSGTLTFLFTDIEGSTRLMQEVGDRYVEAQAAHHAILREAFRNNSGRELRTEGDSFFCVFASALDACSAAAAAQKALAAQAWPEGAAIRVRIGLHTGEAPLVGNEYIGLDVHHAARVAGAAHGGQVLLSESTHALVQDNLPAGIRLRDLGLHRLKDLARSERLFQLVVASLPDSFPALRTLDTTPNNLPTQLTSFIGREPEVESAGALLKGARLLTLTGPGGIGKTRLSLQIAADLIQQFPDGVYFIPLSAVREPGLVASVIAEVLGVAVTGSRLSIDAVVEYLRDRKVLLVLDNFEQLLPEGAPVATQLLKGSPGLKLLVSSRAVLRVYGEQEFAVEPLRLPDLKALPALAALSQYEAVRLFIERAVAAKPDFRATNENAPAIAGVCERVDGLPLAIELAAARVKLFSPQALLGRLESSLTVLGTGSRDLPGRQQTLQAAIAWSYDLLDPPLQRLLARFAVFARGGNLEQAELVCGPAAEVGVDVLTGLDELADQSLLRRLPDFEEPRLLMLQTIREFALERLQQGGEGDLVRDRHAAAFHALAEEAAPRVFGEQQKTWLDRLERDHDNFRAAMDWCVERADAERGLCLGAALWRFWQMRGHLHEGRARLEAVLALAGAHDHPRERRRALEAAGGIAYWQGDMPAAQAFYDECLASTREGGTRAELANAIYNVSFPRMVNRQDLARAAQLLTEALPIFREVGDEAGLGRCLWGLGNADYFAARYPDAIAHLDEAIELFRRLDDRFSLGWALHTRALVALKYLDWAAADAFVVEALEIFSAASDVSGIVLLLDDAAAVARVKGEPRRQIRLAAAATAHQAASGAGLGAILKAEEEWTLREALTSEEDKRAWAEGQAMSLEEAVAYALGRSDSEVEART